MKKLGSTDIIDWVNKAYKDDLRRTADPVVSSRSFMRSSLNDDNVSLHSRRSSVTHLLTKDYPTSSSVVDGDLASENTDELLSASIYQNVNMGGEYHTTLHAGDETILEILHKTMLSNATMKSRSRSLLKNHSTFSHRDVLAQANTFSRIPMISSTPAKFKSNVRNESIQPPHRKRVHLSNKKSMIGDELSSISHTGTLDVSNALLEDSSLRNDGALRKDFSLRNNTLMDEVSELLTSKCIGDKSALTHLHNKEKSPTESPSRSTASFSLITSSTPRFNQSNNSEKRLNRVPVTVTSHQAHANKSSLLSPEFNQLKSFFASSHETGHEMSLLKAEGFLNQLESIVETAKSHLQVIESVTDDKLKLRESSDYLTMRNTFNISNVPGNQAGTPDNEWGTDYEASIPANEGGVPRTNDSLRQNEGYHNARHKVSFTCSTIPYKDNTIPYKDQNIPYKVDTIPYKDNNIQYSDINSSYKDNTIPYKDNNIQYSDINSSYKDHTIPYKDNNIQYSDINSSYKDNTIPYKDNNIQYSDIDSSYKDHTIPYKDKTIQYSDINSSYKDFAIPYKDKIISYKDNNTPYKDHTIPYKDRTIPYKDNSFSYKDNTVQYKETNIPYTETIPSNKMDNQVQYTNQKTVLPSNLNSNLLTLSYRNSIRPMLTDHEINKILETYLTDDVSADFGSTNSFLNTVISEVESIIANNLDSELVIVNQMFKEYIEKNLLNRIKSTMYKKLRLETNGNHFETNLDNNNKSAFRKEFENDFRSKHFAILSSEMKSLNSSFQEYGTQTTDNSSPLNYLSNQTTSAAEISPIGDGYTEETESEMLSNSNDESLNRAYAHLHKLKKLLNERNVLTQQ